MATFENTQLQPFGLKTLSHVTDVLKNVIAKIEEFNKVRAAKAELQNMSTRELNELGISRADINGLF